MHVVSFSRKPLQASPGRDSPLRHGQALSARNRGEGSMVVAPAEIIVDLIADRRIQVVEEDQSRCGSKS
jgi:hypothetical protein